MIRPFLVLFILFTFSKVSSQESDTDAYYFAEKIMQLTKKSDDSIYSMSKEINDSKYLLKKYSKFRFRNKPFYTIVEYDSINDKIGYDTLHLEKNIIKWKKQYKLMDSIFDKEDIERFIDTEIVAKEWDTTNIVFEKKEFPIKWCEYYCENSISRPYYNSEKNYALVVFNTKESKTTFYIFKKEEIDWVIIDTITNKVK